MFAVDVLSGTCRGPTNWRCGSPGWHQAEHLCFLAAGLLFWFPVVQPWPSLAVWPRWTMIPYLLLADLLNTVLSAFFVFSDRVIYPAYAAAPRLWGIAPLDDQAVAGALMWVPGSLVFLLPVVMIVVESLSASGPPRRSGGCAGDAPVRGVLTGRAGRFDLLRCRSSARSCAGATDGASCSSACWRSPRR